MASDRWADVEERSCDLVTVLNLLLLALSCLHPHSGLSRTEGPPIKAYTNFRKISQLANLDSSKKCWKVESFNGLNKLVTAVQSF